MQTQLKLPLCRCSFVSFHQHFHQNTHCEVIVQQLSNSIDSIYKDLLEHIMKTVKTISVTGLLLNIYSFLARQFNNHDSFITVPALK